MHNDNSYGNLIEEAMSGTPCSVPPLWRLVSQNASCIVPLNEAGGIPALYCVHPIGGDVTGFYDLAASLAPDHRCYGIQAPMSRMNAVFGSSIQVLAQHYVDALVAFQPEGAIVLAGWSIGAIISLEMAQLLRAMGREVPLLIALDGGPRNTGGGISPWNPLYTWRLVCNIPRWFKHEMQLSSSMPNFVWRILTEVASSVVVFSRGGKQATHWSAVQNLVNNTGWSRNQIGFINALYEAGNAYVPEPYVGRVIAYEAKIQPLHRLSQVGATWSKFTTFLEVIQVDGKHDTIIRKFYVDSLSRHLRSRLAEL